MHRLIKRVPLSPTKKSSCSGQGPIQRPFPLCIWCLRKSMYGGSAVVVLKEALLSRFWWPVWSGSGQHTWASVKVCVCVSRPRELCSCGFYVWFPDPSPHRAVLLNDSSLISLINLLYVVLFVYSFYRSGLQLYVPPCILEPRCRPCLPCMGSQQEP